MPLLPLTVSLAVVPNDTCAIIAAVLVVMWKSNCTIEASDYLSEAANTTTQADLIDVTSKWVSIQSN